MPTSQKKRDEEGSYLPSKRNSPKNERIENVLLAILISTKQINSMLVLGSSGDIFILRPTNVRIWHKAVFKVGPVAGPKPNAIGSSKNASDPVGIPLFGAPQAPGDKPNPSEEG